MNGRSVEESLARDRRGRHPASGRFDDGRGARIAATVLVVVDVVALVWILVADAAAAVIWVCLQLLVSGLVLICFRRTRMWGVWTLVAFAILVFLGYLALGALAEGLRDS